MPHSSGNFRRRVCVPPGTPLGDAFTADRHLVIGHHPGFFVCWVDSDQRDWIANVLDAFQNLDDVFLGRALVQSFNAFRRFAFPGLNVRRESPFFHFLPLRFHRAMPGFLLETSGVEFLQSAQLLPTGNDIRTTRFGRNYGTVIFVNGSFRLPVQR